jgi:hypothetical protein
MVGCFGLDGPQRQSCTPPERLVDHVPTLDVFALRKAGALADGAVTDLELGPGGTWRLVRAPGKIILGGQEIPVRPHRALPVEVFGCPQCGRDCYRLHFVDGFWRCRTCPPRLKYRSQCRDRSVQGLSRITYLRRRVHADPRPFGPLPERPLQARKHWRLCREIRRLEQALLDHGDKVSGVLERRYYGRE